MQAFSNIRVLDFTHVYAGPFATFQLAVMGADVIKIEPPDRPDQMRGEGVVPELNQQGLGTTYVFNNQGKRAITLDLARHEGVEVAQRLIAGADVLVENYTHGLGQFNLGPAQALEINPRLIYCDMSGYGHAGRFGGRPAYDPVIQASSGMMSLNGRPDQAFIRVGPPLVDYGTGAQAAFAIAAALYQREHSGVGQLIEVNMQDAALVMMSPLVANAIHAGKTEMRSGNGSASRPGYGVYPCRDGDLMIGAFTLTHHRRLFEVLELGQWIDIPEHCDPQWIAEHGEQICAALQSCLAGRSAHDWELCLNAADVPAARVRDLHDVLANEQPARAEHSRIRRIAGSEIGAPIAAFRFAQHGPQLNSRCAQHGEDTDEVLADLGYDAAEITRLRQLGAI